MDFCVFGGNSFLEEQFSLFKRAKMYFWKRRKFKLDQMNMKTLFLVEGQNLKTNLSPNTIKTLTP